MDTAFSRRSFFRLAAAASAAAALPILSESDFAYAASVKRFRWELPPPPGAIRINANENPLGPSKAACNEIISLTCEGGRYDFFRTQKLVSTFSEMEGLKPGYVIAYAGSTNPLHYTVLAYTSKEKSYVTADPGYEAGMRAATLNGAKIIKVPLAADHAHDVRAMVAADPNAGVLYICNPNNPTGTITSKEQIDWAVANKPKDSILLIDEAYIHFSDAVSSIDLVKADKNVIVLRTFSKIYGMAGMRCGFAIGRPDLLEKLSYFGMNANPIMAVSAATVSLQDKTLVQARKKINADIRSETFAWLEKNNYKYIPSQSNCFMLYAGRPGQEMMAAMAQRNVFIGRVWPIMPNWVRITVGTSSEMEKFQAAWHQAMQAPAAATAGLEPPKLPAELVRTPYTHLS